jgi:hypothetical protein
MLTEYELLNVVLAEEHTKARKLSKLKTFKSDKTVVDAVIKQILGSETEKEVMAKAEEEDRIHWIEFYANRAAADLLTLGKVQPETMVAMAGLPEKDFAEVVKKATTRANKLNKITMATEKEMNLDLISNELV